MYCEIFYLYLVVAVYIRNSLNGINGFAINGINTENRSGVSVSSADVNGDGIADIIIGAFGASPNGNPYAGQSYVIFGEPSSLVDSKLAEEIAENIEENV